MTFGLSARTKPLEGSRGHQIGKAADRAVADSETLVKDMTTGIRTIRSELRVDLEVPDDFDRLPRDLETALFHVVQERLTNVHRHSGSTVAQIRLHRSAGDLQLEVRDEGKGIPSEKLFEMAATAAPGVGIRGMRERIHQLRGSLEISSASSKGTVVLGDTACCKRCATG